MATKPQLNIRIKCVYAKQTLTMLTSKFESQPKLRPQSPKSANANETEMRWQMLCVWVCACACECMWICVPSIFHTLNDWINGSIAYIYYLHFKLLPAALIDMFILYVPHTKAFVLPTICSPDRIWASISYFEQISQLSSAIYIYFEAQVDRLFNLPLININSWFDAFVTEALAAAFWQAHVIIETRIPQKSRRIGIHYADTCPSWTAVISWSYKEVCQVAQNML